MRHYFPVDLTGNLIMIEKLVLGEIWTRRPPDLQYQRANLCAIKTSQWNRNLKDPSSQETRTDKMEEDSNRNLK